MINLPKPSVNKAKGTPDEKINYVINYLTMLVNNIEQSFGNSKSRQNNVNVTVKDISFVNGDLIVFYSDGSEKRLNL